MKKGLGAHGPWSVPTIPLFNIPRGSLSTLKKDQAVSLKKPASRYTPLGCQKKSHPKSHKCSYSPPKKCACGIKRWCLRGPADAPRGAEPNPKPVILCLLYFPVLSSPNLNSAMSTALLYSPSFAPSCPVLDSLPVGSLGNSNFTIPGFLV